MDCEKVDISVLVADDDKTALSVIACMLRSFKYKVVTANNGHEALETLREHEDSFDIVISDLHMPVMNGLELQKLINKEFQLPVIVMSEDRRNCVRSKSLKSGAVCFMVKPMRPDDLKNIWQYAVAARKGKGVINEEFGISEEAQSSISSEVGNIGDVNSDLSSETKPKQGIKMKDNKRKASESGTMDGNKDISEEISLMPLKKPKVVWTTELHNQFLMAIKQIGLSKAVPKRILVLMKVPGLTRENVASHLQKYRIFLRKVAEIGAIEGLSDRVLRSKFASGLINDIQNKITQICLPIHQQHVRSSTSSRGTPTTTASSNLSTTILANHQASSSDTNSPVLQARSGQLTIPLGKSSLNPQTQLFSGVSSSLNNQVRHENFGFGIIGSNTIQTTNFQQQPMPGHYQNPLYQANQTYNAGASLLAYGRNGLTGCNDMSYASLGNSCFNYAPSNGNLGYLGQINLSWNSTNNYYPNNNFTGFQFDGGKLALDGMDQTGVNNSVGIPALEGNNSFGLINGSSNAIMHSNQQGLNNGFGLSSFTNGTPIAIMPATPTGNNNRWMDQLGLSNVRVLPYENNRSYGFMDSASNAIMPVAKIWNGMMDRGEFHSVVGKPAYGNNSFGFINGTPNAVMPIAATRDRNSGLLQASADRVRSARELWPPIINNVIQEENVSGFPPSPKQLDHLPSVLINNETQEEDILGLPLLHEQLDGLRNAGNENRHNFNLMSLQGQDQQYSENFLSQLFFELDNMHLLDGEQAVGELQDPNFLMFPTQTGENSTHGDEFINPDFSNTYNAEQYLEQPQGDGDRLAPATEGNIYIPNELSLPSDENPNQQQGIYEFVGLEEP